VESIERVRVDRLEMVQSGQLLWMEVQQALQLQSREV
jgi:hypothetical protein